MDTNNAQSADTTNEEKEKKPNTAKNGALDHLITVRDAVIIALITAVAATAMVAGITLSLSRLNGPTSTPTATQISQQPQLPEVRVSVIVDGHQVETVVGVVAPAPVEDAMGSEHGATQAATALPDTSIEDSVISE